ncbi:hypothetical protein ABS858_15060, partial [Vibrio neptunius]
LESWRAGELESWRAGELESWSAGELESWRNFRGLAFYVNPFSFKKLSCHPQERGTSEVGISSSESMTYRDSLFLPSSV